MNLEPVRRRLASRTVVTVVGFTLVLTAAFVGLVGLVFGGADGVSGRISYYVFVAAIAFVIALWQLDDRNVDGLPVLIGAAGIALGAGFLAGFAIEGVIHAVRNPGEVLDSQLFVYFLAAGLICTGLGLWGLHHWREFTGFDPVE